MILTSCRCTACNVETICTVCTVLYFLYVLYVLDILTYVCTDECFFLSTYLSMDVSMYLCGYVDMWTCVWHLFTLSNTFFEQLVNMHNGTTDVGGMCSPCMCNLNFEPLPLHLTCSSRIFTHNQFIPSPGLLAISYYLVWSKSAFATHAPFATACNRATLLAWLKVMLTLRKRPNKPSK